jgi:arylsulfatase A-like enzyme
VVSVLSGLYPHRHGGGLVPGDPKNLSKANLPTKVPDEIALLPDILGAHGYTTAALGAVWNAHLSIPGRFPAMRMAERSAGVLAARAMGWIRSRPEPFFLWLHLGDAHEPLNIPKRMRHMFGRVPRIRDVTRWAYTKRDDPIDTEAFHRYREARIRLYDVAVRSIDDRLRELFGRLHASGIGGRTVTVVTSDHGEEFWEHRAEEVAGFTDPRDIYGTGHGHNLFQVHLLVPLLFLGPGIVPGAVDRNVSLVDVLPTVLEAAGIESPAVDGCSVHDAVGSDRPVLSEAIAYGHEKHSVVVGDLKMLRSPGDRYERVFRLGPDRREVEEVHDLSATDRLRRLVPRGPEAVGEQVVATEEIERHLRDLGYID